mmetsp:Transcript_38857/g.82654  ORF Transcript_38857/g.82654 Transcript_38857/m.82654 type:complete len:164 (-) Transcript_38857:88-579(-)
MTMVDIKADLHGGVVGAFWLFDMMARASQMPDELGPHMTDDEYELVMQAVNDAIENNGRSAGCSGMCVDSKSRCLCIATIILSPLLVGFLLLERHSQFKAKWVSQDVLEALRPWWEGKGLTVQFIPGLPPTSDGPPGSGRYGGPGTPSIIRIGLPSTVGNSRP